MNYDISVLIVHPTKMLPSNYNNNNFLHSLIFIYVNLTIGSTCRLTTEKNCSTQVFLRKNVYFIILSNKIEVFIVIVVC